MVVNVGPLKSNISIIIVDAKMDVWSYKIR